MNGEVLTRAHERLREELHDDGIVLPGGPAEVETLLAELEHARRPPLHEGRVPLYGSIVVPEGRSLLERDNLVELIELDLPIERCRSFADGRSTFLVRRADGPPLLACFRRTVQYEADLVELELATGTTIVQRTIGGVPRVFTPTGVVEWSGHDWRFRPSAKRRHTSIGRSSSISSTRLSRSSRLRPAGTTIEP